MNVTVTEVEHYTDNLFRIRTERPSTFRFVAGEFVMIGLDNWSEKLQRNKPIMRAYSMTSGPYDEFLEFYSIKVPDGPLTSKLQHLKEGDELIIGDKPTGTLTLNNIELGGDLWMLATGTGIAPFISILRDPTTFDHFRSVNVVWSVRYQEELQSYHKFLQDSKAKYIPTITRAASYPFQNKRITDLLNEGKLMRTGALDKERTKVMICGNLDFNSTIANYFLVLGWEEGNSKTAGVFVQEKAFVG
jgi:ferredoxin--NADP+ reductase